MATYISTQLMISLYLGHTCHLSCAPKVNKLTPYPLVFFVHYSLVPLDVVHTFPQDDLQQEVHGTCILRVVGIVQEER
jgi:hypothetical protein